MIMTMMRTGCSIHRLTQIPRLVSLPPPPRPKAGRRYSPTWTRCLAPAGSCGGCRCPGPTGFCTRRRDPTDPQETQLACGPCMLAFRGMIAHRTVRFIVAQSISFFFNNLPEIGQIVPPISCRALTKHETMSPCDI